MASISVDALLNVCQHKCMAVYLVSYGPQMICQCCLAVVVITLLVQVRSLHRPGSDCGQQALAAGGCRHDQAGPFAALWGCGRSEQQEAGQALFNIQTEPSRCPTVQKTKGAHHQKCEPAFGRLACSALCFSCLSCLSALVLSHGTSSQFADTEMQCICPDLELPVSKASAAWELPSMPLGRRCTYTLSRSGLRKT